MPDTPDHNHRPQPPHGTTQHHPEPDIAAIRDSAFQVMTPQAAAARYPLALDARFFGAPLTPSEMEALQLAATPEESARILGALYQLRPYAQSQPVTPESQTLFDRALSREEQIIHGLQPARDERAFLADTASHQSQRERALEFIIRQQAQNARYALDTNSMARFQKALRNQQLASSARIPPLCPHSSVEPPSTAQLPTSTLQAVLPRAIPALPITR